MSKYKSHDCILRTCVRYLLTNFTPKHKRRIGIWEEVPNQLFIWCCAKIPPAYLRVIDNATAIRRHHFERHYYMV